MSALALAGWGAAAGGALQSMALQLPEFGLLALAIAITMLAGGINLAIVATANLSAIAATLTWAALGQGPLSVVCGLVVGLATGLSCGLICGLAITALRVTPILATLCAMLAFTGAGVLLTGGAALGGLPPSFSAGVNSTFVGMPWILVVFLGVATGLQWMLARTVFGQRVRAIGLNAEASRYSGIDTGAVMLRVYALSGLLSAIAGLVMAGRFNSARAGYGESYLLVAILAAVMGGIHPDGGRGHFSFLVLAVVILQVAASSLNILSVNTHVTTVVWGALLLAKLGVDRVR
ncbi:ABC transporter permease [Pararobbsia silviterrae]|nr:ABC transporter permease [Pararobbsia silviterrae]